MKWNRSGAPWTALVLVGGLTVGAAALGVAMAPGSSSPNRAPTPLPTPVSATALPAASTPNPPTSAPAVPVPPGPPSPPSPGPPTVNPAAWRGHGELAFVSSGHLLEVSNSGAVTAVGGTPGGGFDSNPQWSPDGAVLAFLHTGPTEGYDTPPPTLWVVLAGAGTAREVTSSLVGEYAWSPVRDVLAFTEFNANETTSPETERVWFYEPDESTATATDPGPLPLPQSVVVGTGVGVEAIAWSPDGSALAFGTAQFAQPPTATSPARPPIGFVGTITVAGNQVQTIYQLPEAALSLAGWWPDGGGLLFWEDPGFADSADGDMLYSLAAGSQHPVPLVGGLLNSTWLADSPDGSTVAVVAGNGRTVWQAGRDVTLCQFPAATCSPVPIPAGSVGLAPSWTANGDLVFADASASGPFGPTGGAFWTPGWMAQWNATNRLLADVPGTPPTAVAPAPAGSLLATPAAHGPSMLVVADDQLWLVNPDGTGTPTVRVAGPLYSTAGPSGYYGEVDWAGTFAWSAAAPSTRTTASTILLEEGFGSPAAEMP